MPDLPRPEHGLHLTTPPPTWDEGLPLGNGMLGALLWGTGAPLNLSLDRTDLWDLQPVPEFYSPWYTYRQMVRWHHEGRHDDLNRQYDQPYRHPAPTKVPAGRLELTFDGAFAAAELDLAGATATVALGGSRVQALLHATRPVGLLAVVGAAPAGLRLVAPDFTRRPGEEPAVGSLASLDYPPPERYASDSEQAFFQQGGGGLQFAVVVGWRQQEALWLGAWSVVSGVEVTDPLQQARSNVLSALDGGWDEAVLSHRAWWAGYWGQSAVSVPDPVTERQYYLDQYKFGAAARRGAPPITLQGPWTADDGQLPPWKADYHHDLNTELSYWPCYAANRLDAGLGFLDWLWATRATNMAWTRRFFQLPGLCVPMTADLAGEQIGGWRQYTHSPTTAAWLCHHFYLHYRYSGDHEFLMERAYPYLREAALFLTLLTAERDDDGRRRIPLSASPEIHENKPEAWFEQWTNYDLALTRWLLAACIELALEADLKSDAQLWRGVLASLPPLARGADGGLLVAPDFPLPASHRHFSHLMAIHPLGLIDLTDGPEAQQTIAAALAELDRLGTDYWCGYSFAWLANLAARAGDGERAAQALQTFATAFCLPNSFHCNGDQSGTGLSKFTYRPFTLEGNFAAAAGLQEMLLQSHRGRLVLFPAIPESWRDVAFTTLRAQGGFLVSARRTAGVVASVTITAEHEGECRLVSPFSGRLLTLEFAAGERKVLTADPA